MNRWRILTGKIETGGNRFVEQEATFLSVEGGVLLFRDGTGQLLRAYGIGAWQTVEPVEPPSAGEAFTRG